MAYVSLEQLEERLVEGQYKYTYFVIMIMSSYGLNGWILAKIHEIITISTQSGD